MTCITVDAVKSFLGITATTYDDAIESKIPYIDVTVKRITKNKFNLQIIGSTTSGSKTITVSAVYAYSGVLFDHSAVSLDDVLTIGQMVEGTGIPAGAYITDINSSGFLDVSTISISSNATATGSTSIMTGVPVDLQQVIAKGIWYLIQNDSTIIKDDNWVSRSMGPLSVTRSDSDNRTDSISGMPIWFVKAFPSFQSGF